MAINAHIVHQPRNAQPVNLVPQNQPLQNPNQVPNAQPILSAPPNQLPQNQNPIQPLQNTIPTLNQPIAVKLTDTNHLLWQTHMMNIIIANGLEGHIDGSMP